MARVPQYDQQVQERPLPSGQQSTVASPSMFSGNAEGEAALGRGLLTAGTTGSNIAIQIQDRENADMIFRAETAFNEELGKTVTDARTRKGANAKGVVGDVDNAIGESAKKHIEGLGNDVQRRLFMQKVEQSRVRTVTTMREFENEQRDVSLVESSQAAIGTIISNAANAAADGYLAKVQGSEQTGKPARSVDADGNPIATAPGVEVAQSGVSVNDFLKDVRQHSAVLAKIKGWDASVKDAYESKQVSMLHEQVIKNLNIKDPKAAKAYYDEAVKKGEILGTQRDDIAKLLDVSVATSTGNDAARSVWEAMRPRGSSDPVLLADMESKIREQLKGDEKAIDVAIKEVRSIAQGYRDQRKEQGNAMEAGVNSLVLAGRSSSEIRRSQEFIALASKDPEAARKIDTYLENRDYTRTARAAAEEGRALAREQREERAKFNKSFETVLRVSDPAVLSALSRNEVINLLPAIGREHTAALLQKHEMYAKNQAALSEAKIDNDQFKDFAMRAGLDPTNTKDKDNAKRLVELRDRVEGIIGAEQQAAKRPLTREQKDAIMQREIDNHVIQYRAILPNKEVPAIALPRDAQQNAFVEVPDAKGVTQRVRLSEVPPAFREQAVIERRKAGLYTSESDVARLWLANKSNWKNPIKPIRPAQ